MKKIIKNISNIFRKKKEIQKTVDLSNPNLCDWDKKYFDLLERGLVDKEQYEYYRYLSFIYPEKCIKPG